MTGQPGLPAAGPVAAGFDKAASAYDAAGTEFFAVLGAKLVTHAGIKPGDRVADLGCGAGAALIPAALAAGPGGRVTGVDASPAMLARAGEAARARGAEVTLLSGDAENPPLPPGSLDVITASSVLPFLPRPQQAMQAWLGLLARGGRLAVSWGMQQDPAWVPVMDILDREVPRPAQGIEEYLRRPPFNSAEALAHALTGAGYTSVVTREEPVTTSYRTPEQWWAACQGQAPWIVSWRHIPGGALEAARRAACTLAEGLRGEDGLIRRTITFGCTIASRPS